MLQPNMKWGTVNDATGENKVFQILEVPENPNSTDTMPHFPFGGTGYNSEAVRLLMLRVSHYHLYKTILVQLGVSKLIHAGFKHTEFGHEEFGRQFVVSGPPGIGKSVMLNLIWYVALFEFGMDVICHMPRNDIDLYRNGSGTVERLDENGAKVMLLKWNTVYLFDSDEKGELSPIYSLMNKATNVITTSPKISHNCVNLVKHDCMPKDICVIPLWSYAWSYNEIITGLNTLGFTEVRSISKAVQGSFRYALKAVTDPVAFHDAILKDNLTSVISLVTKTKLKIPSKEVIVDMITTGTLQCQPFHSIETQQAPEFEKNVSLTILGYLKDLKTEPVQELPELINVLKNAKEPKTVKAFAKGQQTARQYHSYFSLKKEWQS